MLTDMALQQQPPSLLMHPVPAAFPLQPSTALQLQSAPRCLHLQTLLDPHLHPLRQHHPHLHLLTHPSPQQMSSLCLMGLKPHSTTQITPVCMRLVLQVVLWVLTPP